MSKYFKVSVLYPGFHIKCNCIFLHKVCQKRESTLIWGEVKRKSITLSFSLSLSLIFMFVVVFLLHFIIILGVGLPAYLSNHNLFSREHIFIGFNEFSSLMCWCIVIHHHWPQGPTLFRRVKWDFMCVHRQGTSCFESHPRRLSNVQ